MKWSHILFHHVGAEHDFDQVKDYHVRVRGWSDIGYHYFIERDGTVKEGRPLSRRGAHSIEANGFAIGICLSGDFTKRQPTKAQYEAAAKIGYELMQRFNIPVGNLKTHKDFSPTLCPGDNFDLNKIKILICDLINPKPKTLYLVQVGAFAQRDNAEKLAKELKNKGYDVIIKKEELNNGPNGIVS